MSSPLYGRLRLLFQQKPTPTTTSNTTVSVTSVSTSIKRSSGVVSSKLDKKLQDIVQRFKERSSHSHFRHNQSHYHATVRRLARAGLFSSIHDIIDHQKQFPEIKNEKFTARLILLYGKAKMLDDALKLFDEMPDLNCPQTVVSVNSLMATCFPSRRFDKAIELFQELPEKLSIKPDAITYGMAIRAFCQMGSIDEAMSLFQDLEKNDLKPHLVTFSFLLDGLYGNGRYNEAENLWRLMEEENVTPNSRCYNSRLFGMVMEKQPGAMDLFTEMKNKGLEPNHYTYNLMIRWFVNEGILEEVKKWYATMIDCGFFPDPITFSAVIPFACDKNDIDFAYELLRKRSTGRGNSGLRNLVHQVIDKLVEQSEIGKAEELRELYASSSNREPVLGKPPMTDDDGDGGGGGKVQ